MLARYMTSFSQSYMHLVPLHDSRALTILESLKDLFKKIAAESNELYKSEE